MALFTTTSIAQSKIDQKGRTELLEPLNFDVGHFREDGFQLHTTCRPDSPVIPGDGNEYYSSPRPCGDVSRNSVWGVVVTKDKSGNYAGATKFDTTRAAPAPKLNIKRKSFSGSTPVEFNCTNAGSTTEPCVAVGSDLCAKLDKILGDRVVWNMSEDDFKKAYPGGGEESPRWRLQYLVADFFALTREQGEIVQKQLAELYRQGKIQQPPIHGTGGRVTKKKGAASARIVSDEPSDEKPVVKAMIDQEYSLPLGKKIGRLQNRCQNASLAPTPRSSTPATQAGSGTDTRAE